MRNLLFGLAVAVMLAPVGYLAHAQGAQPKTLSFFITSVGLGDGANLSGLKGADAHCAALAKAVGAGNREWRAYLSTQGAGAVSAKDRIGTGPWFNSKGVQVAASVADLHSDKNNLTKETQLTEKGDIVNGRGDKPNTHDILTGSQLDGTAFTDADDHTCNNWTSNSTGAAQVGHHDRQGGGINPTSWNNAHPSKGCSQDALRGSGGAGLFYCFATK